MKCINLPEVGKVFNERSHGYMVVYLKEKYWLYHVYDDQSVVLTYKYFCSNEYNGETLEQWFDLPRHLYYNGKPVFEEEPTYTLCEKYRGVILRDNSGETYIITSSYNTWSEKPSYSLFRYAHRNMGYKLNRDIGGTGTCNLNDSLLLSLDLEKSNGGKLIGETHVSV